MITDPKWGIRPLPDWVDGFRDGQEDIIDGITERFQAGCKVVFLQAPTGVGKSLIGECVRRRLNSPGVYSCSTIALQEQFKADFDYGQIVKGRGNYLTLAGPLNRFGRRSNNGKSAVTCADCTFNRDDGCRWCAIRNSCPYIAAKNRAKISELAILNTAYFLTGSNKGQRDFTGRPLAIIDEADLLEKETLNQVEVFISNRRMNKIGIEPPPRKTVVKTWLPWVTDEAIPKVKVYYEAQINGVSDGRTATIEEIREANSISELLDRLSTLESGLHNGGWVYDGYNNGDTIFRPIEVNSYGREFIWPHAQRFLLMSATILSADKMADQLGLTDKYDTIDVDSPFPIQNRPIYVVPIANMSHKLKETEWPKLVEGIKGILNHHPTERILIHAVSYNLSSFITGKLSGLYDRGVYNYTDRESKNVALSQYRRDNGAVIVAPSLDRGIDLPDDLCRVQVVAKIPFMDLTDKRVQARMNTTKAGHAWYKMEAIRNLVQMTGRGVRSKDDWATSYILDKQFMDNIMSSKYLLPKWWKDALRMDLGPRRLQQWANGS